MEQIITSPYRQEYPSWDSQLVSEFERDDILKLHSSLPSYEPTPLSRLNHLASNFGLGRIIVKDESHRFGLKAFKALGASYAVYRFIKQTLHAQDNDLPEPENFYQNFDLLPPASHTLTTASDGNHGRGVAWTARILGQKAVIYMPENTVPARIKNIESEGAEVRIVRGSYDDAVDQSRNDAKEHGWQIISDTSWPGYEEIPSWIMAGYRTMFEEIHAQLQDGEKIDVVFVQAGVGALAATCTWFYNANPAYSNTRIISVEPTSAACLLQSITYGKGDPISIKGGQDSIMAGLNCGTPSYLAWPIIKTGIAYFQSIDDSRVVDAMKTYYYPQKNDPQIISGESGASSMAALKMLCADDSFTEARKELRLDRGSTVLLLNTEGDTDPGFFDMNVRRL